MEKRILKNRLREWHTNWPIRRTLLLCGATAYAASLAAICLPFWSVAIPLLAMVLVLLLPRLRRPHILLVCGVAVCFWLGGVGYQVRYVQPLQALSGQTDTLSGWVKATPSTGSLYTLCVTDSQQLPTGTRVLLYCPEICAPERYETLTATVELTAVDRERTSFLADGVFLLAFPTGFGEEAVTITGTADDPPFLHRVQALREPLHRILRQTLPGDEGAMLAAVCLGEQQALSPDLQAIFRGSGLSHILVVSGLHLSMVVLAVRTLLRKFRLSKRLSSLLTVPVLIAFMLLVELTPSVVRAGVMCMLWLVGQSLRRRADGLNSLGLAALILLMYNPYIAVDPGFLLSFAATAGVLCLLPRLLPRTPAFDSNRLRYAGRRLAYGVLSILATTLCASLFLLPLLCHYFGGFPLVTPLANLVAVPPATYALLSGWAGILLSVLPGGFILGKPLLLVAGALARLSITAATLCSTISGWIPVTELWAFLLVCSGCVVLAVGIYARSRRVWWRVSISLLLMGVLAISTNALFHQHSITLTAIAAGSGVAVLMQDGATTTLLIPHSDGIDEAAALLEKEGQTRLDYLFIGKGDPSYAGCLAKLLRKIPSGQIASPDDVAWTAGLGTKMVSLPTGQPFSTGNAVWQADAVNHWQVTVDGTTYYLYETNHPHNALTLSADGKQTTIRLAG